MAKVARRTEHVTLGTEPLGKIIISERGCETYGPRDEYLCTYPTVPMARRALFELHRDSSAGLSQ